MKFRWTDYKKVKSKEQARQIAIDYQNWASERDLSYSDLAMISNYFNKIGKKFNLKGEFRENGII